MTPLTEGTLARIHVLFPADQHANVENLLETQCGSNLLYPKSSTEELVRVRYAVLKLSEGKLDKLQEAIDLVRRDFRDVLMAAGFGHDIQAHQSWFPTPIARTPPSQQFNHHG